MSARETAIGVMVLALVSRAAAHRVDEYLIATMISLEKNALKADMFLTPGVAVLPVVLAQIDSDGDGIFSATEQRAYATRVLADLTLTLNGERLAPRLVAMEFPKIEALKEGIGDIHLEFAVDIPSAGSARALRFENRHNAAIAAYQVNCLVPRDPEIRIGSEQRDYSQSVYEISYRRLKAEER